MGDFYRGWRRKVGVLTLLIACMMMAGAIRSFSTADAIYSDTLQIYSHHGGIYCETIPSRFSFVIYYESCDQKYVRNPYSNPRMEDHPWTLKAFGFAFYSKVTDFKNNDGSNSKVLFISFYVPYWSIVLPLALTSAYLLLVTPRAKKTKKVLVD